MKHDVLRKSDLNFKLRQLQGFDPIEELSNEEEKSCSFSKKRSLDMHFGLGSKSIAG